MDGGIDPYIARFAAYWAGAGTTAVCIGLPKSLAMVTEGVLEDCPEGLEPAVVTDADRLGLPLRRVSVETDLLEAVGAEKEFASSPAAVSWRVDRLGRPCRKVSVEADLVDPSLTGTSSCTIGVSGRASAI